MNVRSAFSWSLHGDRLNSAFHPRDRLRVAAAIIDGVVVSTLLWMAILLFAH